MTIVSCENANDENESETSENREGRSNLQTENVVKFESKFLKLLGVMVSAEKLCEQELGLYLDFGTYL